MTVKNCVICFRFSLFIFSAVISEATVIISVNSVIVFVLISVMTVIVFVLISVIAVIFFVLISAISWPWSFSGRRAQDYLQLGIN